jgi:hypothetical protein
MREEHTIFENHILSFFIMDVIYIFSFSFLNESKSNVIVAMDKLYRKNIQNSPVASTKIEIWTDRRIKLN